MLTIEQQRNLLTKIFTLVGHQEEDLSDMMIMFYAGVTGKLEENPASAELEDAIENVLNPDGTNPDGEITNANELLAYFEVVQKHNLEKMFDEAFWAYLHEYVETIRPTLSKEQAEGIDGAISENK